MLVKTSSTISFSNSALVGNGAIIPANRLTIAIASN